MKYWAFLLISASLIACKQDLSSDEQILYDEVMVIHDEVMPKISNMNLLQSKLEKMLPDAPEGAVKALVQKNIGDLSSANDAMFEWMNNFKKKKDLPEGISYSNYLSSEKIKIQRVSNAMLSSIAASEELIEKMPK